MLLRLQRQTPVLATFTGRGDSSERKFSHWAVVGCSGAATTGLCSARDGVDRAAGGPSGGGGGDGGRAAVPARAPDASPPTSGA